MNTSEITMTGMEKVLRAVEDSADAANILALEMAIGSFEAGDDGPACTDRLLKTADCAVRATGDMARLMRSAGLF